MKQEKEIVRLLEQIIDLLRDIKDDTLSIDNFISQLQIVRIDEKEGEG